MAEQDANEIERAGITKLVGSDPNGAETNPVKASTDGELHIRDTHDGGGVDKVISLTTTPVLGIVGSLVKTNRKYVILEGLSTNIKWGFSETTQSFDIFKSQLLMVPIGPATTIWFKMVIGTGEVSFGEIS